jgi:pimeloyl-ACP methyl ester carboxylesterase
MYKLYKTSDSQIIAYKRTKIKKKNQSLPSGLIRGSRGTPQTLGSSPRETTIIFLHGLLSSSEGSKAVALYNHCQEQDIDFLAFDNFGHGKSSGDFKAQTLSDWLSGLEIVLDNIVTNDVILVGSSAGAWTALLGAIKYKRVKGLICIAPAPDFTETIWCGLSEEEREQMKAEGWIGVRGDNCHEPYPISYKLIEESRQHLLLNKDAIAIDCPVHLIHGRQEKDVPHTISLQLLEKIRSEHVVLKLIKDGDHSLSSPTFMRIIIDSLEEMLPQLTIALVGGGPDQANKLL